jgi:hypothetical protein
VQCLDEFARSKPYYPKQVQHQRFLAALFLMIRMLAILEEAAQGKRSRGAAAVDGRVRVSNIIDMIVGIFDAPISSEALVALAATEKSSNQRT